MTKKKNKFLTFCFSLIPGAGEMYMGFMKMGLSLMGAFVGICAAATLFELGPIMFVAIIAWFYSFFHVHNLAGMPDEEFYALEDEYLFHLMGKDAYREDWIRRYRKLIAAVLILMGVVLLWNSIYSMIRPYIPEGLSWFLNDIRYTLPNIILGIAVIIGGVLLIRGKKRELYEEEAGQNGEGR